MEDMWKVEEDTGVLIDTMQELEVAWQIKTNHVSSGVAIPVTPSAHSGRPLALQLDTEASLRRQQEGMYSIRRVCDSDIGRYT